MDPAERELPSSGEALFVDPESDLTVPASVADVRAAYRNTVEEVIGEWRSMFGALGIGYEVVLDRRAVRRAASARLRRAPAAAAMSFLAPLYLLLAGAIAVPLLIHLMRRTVGARVEFPGRALSRARREGAQPHAPD